MIDNLTPADPPVDNFLCVGDPVALMTALTRCGLGRAPAGRLVCVTPPLAAEVVARLAPVRSPNARSGLVVYQDPTDQAVWVAAWPSFAGGGGDAAETAGPNGRRLIRAYAEEALRRRVEVAAALSFRSATECGYTLTPGGLALSFSILDPDTMNETIITFIVDQQGNVTEDVTGATGTACQAVTEPYARALGRVTDTQVKPEFYQRAVEAVRVGAAAS